VKESRKFELARLKKKKKKTEEEEEEEEERKTFWPSGDFLIRCFRDACWRHWVRFCEICLY